MMRALNWLVMLLLFGVTAFLGVFWLGSIQQYDELMQAGALPVFLARAGGISLLGLGLALAWWLLNWLLTQALALGTINLTVLAVRLSIAAVAGAICGTIVFCWH